jgi:predicted Rossmann-fold nucleotide-binding protein
LYGSKYCSIFGVDLLAQAEKISEQHVLRGARPFGASIDDENPYIVTGGRPNAA